jgi:hypothetical protein
VKHDRHGQHVYGGVHKAERKRFARRMRMGEVLYCWRPNCRKPVDPANWDLGHVDREYLAEFGRRWPEHPRCNRATLSHAKGVGVSASAGVKDLKDPRTGEVREPGESAVEHWFKVGPPDRWSRHWLGGYTDRCRDCRRLGRACPAADPDEAA